ncbi:MAG: hypothetical protein PHC61_01025 [Chitinivibrionales bacterium]|nr:hypothetical protein [Chitinivibrionales bacterium]
MNSVLKVVFGAGLFFLVGQMGGCASSSLVGIWHDPSYQSAPLGKMLVIAVRKDGAKRRLWEDAFAGELAKQGVGATQSYRLFPDAPPDTNQIMATVQTNNFDGIMVIQRLPTEKNVQYIQEYTSTVQNVRYSFYWQRYWTYYTEIDHPGYIDTQKVAIRTIDVTTTGHDGRLVWSATSRTPDPRTVTDMQQGIAGLVIRDLAHHGIIGSKK